MIVAFAAVESVVLGAERLVHERYLAHVTEKALLVPVLVLVGQVLRVGADLFAAFFARVGEQLLVALDAVRMLVL